MLESEIIKVIKDTTDRFKRPDLYRRPIVSFSYAKDERYAGLKSVIGQWHMLPTEMMAEAESVISYFVPFTKEVVDEPAKAQWETFLWAEGYEESKGLFNAVNSAVSLLLSNYGYKAAMVSGTNSYSPLELKSGWSHKSAAAIAGLGAFGPNRLLITERGSGGRFCSVITSAKLKVNATPFENKCLYAKNSSCRKCIDACPVGAIKFDGFDKFACNEELLRNQKRNREMAGFDSDVCGKCLSVCPVGDIE